jgi:D-glycero-alpha-D-manno-heptose 1-phosphate guanylyltransferase
VEAIVLAGGKGTRLREVVPDLPKPMALINGRPFLELLLSSLERKGIQRAILSIGYMADVISKHFGSQYGKMKLVYEVETTPLGTGGAIRAALSHAKEDHVFIFNGDTYLDVEVSELEKLWKQNLRPIIVGCEIEDTERYGRLNVENAQVTGILEKGVKGKGWINGGCYVVSSDLLNSFALNTPFSFENDFLKQALSNHQFGLYVTKGHFIDIGIPADYARAQIELAELSKK